MAEICIYIISGYLICGFLLFVLIDIFIDTYKDVKETVIAVLENTKKDLPQSEQDQYFPPQKQKRIILEHYIGVMATIIIAWPFFLLIAFKSRQSKG